MTFIMILIALVLERFFHWHHLRHFQWLPRYERWLSVRLNALPAALIWVVIVVPPVLLIALLQCVLAGWWWGILKLIFSAAILLYCLGPNNLWVQAYHCINELKKQSPAAAEHAQATFGFTATDTSHAFHHTFVKAIFSAFHQRLFAVIFWFALFGPAGAVAYRLIEAISAQAMTGTKLVGQMKEILDWLPIRLETFLFALSGHFTAVFACWKRGVLKGMNTNHAFLTECGAAALARVESSQPLEAGVAEQEALALIDRVLVIGLVLLAMIVLLVW